MPLDYRSFYKQLFETIIDQELTPIELFENARKFSFQVYDMNCYGCLDMVDVFTFIKDVKNEDTF